MISNAFTLSIGLNFGLALTTIIDILPNFMEEFRIYQPFIINDMLEIKYVKEVVKNLNYQGYSIGFGQKEVLNQYLSYVIFTDHLSQVKWNIPSFAVMLVVSKIQAEEDLMEVEVGIGCEVLFLDWVSYKVYESYTINKIHITRYLGQFNQNSAGETIFVSSQDYIPNMENRRGNFYGLQLTGGIMAGEIGNNSNLVQFLPNIDTYDVTKLITNPTHYDKFWNVFEVKILELMETRFNFTSKLLLRKDGKLGGPHISSNGSTEIGEGIFQNLVEGSIEFIWDYLYMLPIRQQLVDYLPVVRSYHDAIFVKVEDSLEEIDWNVFFHPFTLEVWMAIVIKSIVFTILAIIIECIHDCKIVSLYFFQVLITLLQSICLIFFKCRRLVI